MGVGGQLPPQIFDKSEAKQMIFYISASPPDFYHFHPLYTDLYVRVEMFLEFPKYAYLWFLYLEELSLLYLPGNYYNYVYI